MEQNNESKSGRYPTRKRSYTVQAVVRAVAVLNAFASTSEVLDLRVVAERVALNKGTTFRLLETLVETGLLERAGKQGYRSQIQTTRAKRFRIGYASQSHVLPFTAAVSDGLITAAAAANIELLILNNKFSAKTSLQNGLCTRKWGRGHITRLSEKWREQLDSAICERVIGHDC